MAKYDVTFSCGHTETVQLFGKIDDRYKKIEWYEQNGLCSACYKAKKEQEKKEAEAQKAKEASDLGLPELTGSDKQIAWANKIRVKIIGQIDDLIKELDEGMKHTHNAETKKDQMLGLEFLNLLSESFGKESSASKIIDERYVNPNELVVIFVQNYEGFKSGRYIPEDFGKGKIFEDIVKSMLGEKEPEKKETTLSPEDKKSEVLVKVTYTDKEVSIESSKDNEVISISKKNGYRWNGSSWVLSIGLKTGSAEDRAADITNQFLNAGYSVTVPVDIESSAVSGDFESRCYRWIMRHGDDTEHVYISWEKNDDMYEKAKAITGAKWIHGEGLQVPASSADELEDFADIYGFRFSDGAKGNISSYRKSVTIVAPETKETVKADKDVKDILNSSREIIDDLKDGD